MKTKIKTIDVHCLEWFDKVNGNSYFSAQITVNYGTPTQETYKIPFQYGYGDHYQQIALITLQDLGHFANVSQLWKLKDLGVIVRTSKQTALKREVKNYGI
jgi:hypothetical protein